MKSRLLTVISVIEQYGPSPVFPHVFLYATSMMKMFLRSVMVALFGLSFCLPVRAQIPEQSVLSSGWQLRDANKVSDNPDQVSLVSYAATDWYKATVPGTVLTTLVDNGVYPEPLYGENNRPDKIPESLCHTEWWYRTTFPVPADYAGKQVWLNFDGINYMAEVWVNGKSVGTINGAFVRGTFNITSLVSPGKDSAVAVRVYPQFHPGVPAEHTMGAGNGPIGGVTRLDGPTFACSIGWDWMPGHPRPRDRHLAEGFSLRHRAGDHQGPADHDGLAAAANRFG